LVPLTSAIAGRLMVTTAGVLLIAGFGVFMVGASAWRLEYQAPLPERLPVLHSDLWRLRWIHSTMVAAMILTPAGLAALAAPDQGLMRRRWSAFSKVL